MSDARDEAARYLARRDGDECSPEESERSPAAPLNAQNRAAVIESSIQQAIRRGEFDGLHGAGKPLTNLGAPHDPDWWIRRKVETENLSGLGPPALRLRVESLELEDRLDLLPREDDVREALEDFNARVVEARRQLLGGPPVVTPTRDVTAEIEAWRERRSARHAAPAESPAARPRRRLRRWFGR